jgi:Zn-dependent protease
MLPTDSGAIRLFRFAGIQVYLHWSWFVVGVIELQARAHRYSSLSWNVVEYLALFVIVLLHEFGHALACRQTGGRADQIILWPLGGVAFVAPPQRPGAVLWSIAAGPLVNVVLVPLFVGLLWLARGSGWYTTHPDFVKFIQDVGWVNTILLIFNLLPIYPLDGGQILQALLWFVVGRTRSLMIVTVLGFFGVAGLGLLAVYWSSIWLGILAFFAATRCVAGFKQAKLLSALERAPRRTGFACPSCHEPPPLGAVWVCPRCRQPFDPFVTHAVCPRCQNVSTTTACAYCGVSSPIDQWGGPPAASAPPPVIDI